MIYEINSWLAPFYFSLKKDITKPIVQKVSVCVVIQNEDEKVVNFVVFK